MTQAFDAICTLLYGNKNPYTEYKDDILKDRAPAFDPFGFDAGTQCVYFKEAIDAHDAATPMTIVEVGSLLGTSSRLMAGLCRERNLNAVIICCDTWRGDYILNYMPEYRQPMMRPHHGTCTMYDRFIENVLATGFDDIIYPFPMDSVNTAQALIHAGVVADLIYIDGSHTEGLVRFDLENHWKILRTGGMLICDDYDITVPMFDGLRRDVDAFVIDKHAARVAINCRKIRLVKARTRL